MALIQEVQGNHERFSKRAVTADTAIRLALALCTSEQFWMELQADFDLEEAKKSAKKKLYKVEHIAA
ncbi:MAG: hypothetical protein WBN81_01955 [Gammaproteobacteria bacterium]